MCRASVIGLDPPGQRAGPRDLHASMQNRVKGMAVLNQRTLRGDPFHIKEIQSCQLVFSDYYNSKACLDPSAVVFFLHPSAVSHNGCSPP